MSRRRDVGEGRADASVDEPPRRSPFLGPAWDIRIIENAVAAEDPIDVPSGEERDDA
ncbi:hypothetical protein [Microbacterium aurantiacum]|uniref:hypothetical protein n=1 Tax=Microbacterium aurantiacum TaxID=162393 RepID=UPI0015E0AEB9|nr:hypothetical protein [Microbacterium aurantiacum]